MANLPQRLSAIQLIIMDVDGVLTDGAIIYGHEDEHKQFNVQDGMGITLARQAGLKTAILTGRNSPMVQRRAEELKIDYIEQGHFDKRIGLDVIMDACQCTAQEILYIGDDILDLRLQPLVGLFVGPANSHRRVKEDADWITQAAGGSGCLREVVDSVLDAKGLLQQTEDYFIRESI